jgi:hypothetical protein
MVAHIHIFVCPVGDTTLKNKYCFNFYTVTNAMILSTSALWVLGFCLDTGVFAGRVV